MSRPAGVKRKHMRSKNLIAILVASILLTCGCHTEYLGSNSAEKTFNKTRRRSVNYPPPSSLQFPEEQVIKKEFKVTNQWQTITFEKPLKVNRKGLMGLHLAVDQEPFISTTDDDPRNLDCSKAEYQKNAFSLRRRSDGVLIRPEAVLIGDNGIEVKIRPVGHLYPYFDQYIRTIELGVCDDINAPGRSGKQ